ncbi:MAG: hypothetical protein AAF196_08530 [Planctomycetota bacterium]
MANTPPPVPGPDGDAAPPLTDPNPAATAPSTPTDDKDEVRFFPCQSCGADLEFHIGAQRLKCSFCGHEEDLDHEDGGIAENDLESALERESERRSSNRDRVAEGEQGELSEIRCTNCAAEVTFEGTLTADECPYCGTPLQRDDVHRATERLPVDGVLPFRVEREKARANLAKWVKGLWFAPTDFKKRGVQGRFEGCYLPFWTFDAMTATRYTGQRGDHYTVTRKVGDRTVTETRTRWRSASGKFRRFFDDELVLATGGLPESTVDKLEPWPLATLQPFSPGYLSGYLARTYDIPLKRGFQTAKSRIESALRSDVKRRIGGDVQRISSMDTRYAGLKYKHLLLPCWLLTYKYGEKRYQIVVNAVTGEVQGQRPWSAWKIAFAVILGLAIVGVIVYFAQGN